MHQVKPGDEVNHQGTTWTVRKIELRGDDRWAMLVITTGSGSNERLTAVRWVRFEDLEG